MLVVKSRDELIDILSKTGYRLDTKGDSRKTGELPFYWDMFYYCKAKPCDFYKWKSEWLRENK